MSFRHACLIGGAACAAVLAAAPAIAREPVEVDARLGQRILKERATQRVYVRVGLKGVRAERAEARTPVNVALVIDRSGSMQGDKMAKAREAAAMAVDRLSERDVASIVIFDDKVDVLVPATRVTDHRLFKDRIERVTSRGTTAIHAAVEEASRELRKFKSQDRLNRIILMSDGLANVGPSRPSDFADLGRKLGGDGISISTIGLGRDYNEELMSRLASASDGNHAFAKTGSDLAEIFNKEFDDVLSVSAQEIEVLIETRAGIRPLRSLGRDAELSSDRARFRVNQIYGAVEHSLQIEVEVPADVAAGEIEIARVKVSYLAPGSSTRRTFETSVRARFSASEAEVSSSIDAAVMEPIVELEARAVSEKAILLRDEGKADDARKMLESNAAAVGAAQDKYKIQSVRLKKLEEQYRNDAAEVAAGRDWQSQRKLMFQGLGNAPKAATRY